MEAVLEQTIIGSAQDRQRSFANSHCTELQLKIGSKVWLSTENTVQASRGAPESLPGYTQALLSMTIWSRASINKLELLRTMRTTVSFTSPTSNRSRTTRVMSSTCPRPAASPDPVYTCANGTAVHEVESIIYERVTSTAFQHWVKWRGSDITTWEPPSNPRQAQLAIANCKNLFVVDIPWIYNTFYLTEWTDPIHTTF